MTLITDIRTEIWDASENDDRIQMRITIYNGAPDSKHYASLNITKEEAKQITGKKFKKLLGFTEWSTGSHLLFMNLPKRVDDWAIETIAGYVELAPDHVRAVRVAAKKLAG